jgi:hypothetical protein
MTCCRCGCSGCWWMSCPGCESHLLLLLVRCKPPAATCWCCVRRAGGCSLVIAACCLFPASAFHSLGGAAASIDLRGGSMHSCDDCRCWWMKQSGRALAWTPWQQHSFTFRWVVLLQWLNCSWFVILGRDQEAGGGCFVLMDAIRETICHHIKPFKLQSVSGMLVGQCMCVCGSVLRG